MIGGSPNEKCSAVRKSAIGIYTCRPYCRFYHHARISAECLREPKPRLSRRDEGSDNCVDTNGSTGGSYKTKGLKRATIEFSNTAWRQ